MKVEDVMSANPLTVSVDEYVTHAREIMRDNNVQCLPAVKDGKYNGMVTIQDIINVTSTKSNVTLNGYVRWEQSTLSPSTDLTKAAVGILKTGEDRMAVLDGNRVVGVLSIVDVYKAIEELGPGDVPVKDIMTRKVIVCEPGDDISRVWRNMTEYNIFGFPVVLTRQQVIGMITREDVLRRGYVRFERESNVIKTPPSTVQMIMSTPAITIGEGDSSLTAARIFTERQIGRLPVIRNGALTGIVDRYDVLATCRRLVAVE